MPTTNDTHRRDLRDIDPAELRDTIRVTIDRELIDRELIAELDRQRTSVSRSAFLEMVLRANLPREHPHLADDWSPEPAAERRFARLTRYLETGR